MLLASSVAVWWSERGLKTGRRWQQPLGLGIAALLGLVFLAVQGLEWMKKPFRPDTSTYGSLYFTITGFHMAHVVAGLLMLAALLLWSLMGYFDARRHSALSIGAVYWHFVTAVWLAVFGALYLAPRFGAGA